MKILSAVLLSLFFYTTCFAAFLGDPVFVTSGGLGISSVPSAGQIPIGTGSIYAVHVLSGDVTMTSGGVVTIANSAVSNAKLANMNNGLVKSNISGSAAAPSDNTLTAIMDSVFGNAQGDILYRNATAWVVLAPGTSGQFLQTSGASANVSWASAGSGDVSSNTSSSVDGEIVLFNSTTGKSVKRATGTGYVKATSGVYSTQSSPIPSSDLSGKRTLNTQSGATYTFALADGVNAGSLALTQFTSGSAVTVTVPTNASVAFPVGEQIDFSQEGAGKVTLVGAGGVTINSLSGNLSLAGQYVGASLVKTATNTWTLYGNLIP